MNDIYELVTSPVWWFSVVFISLLVNLLAYFLGPRIEKRFGAFSEKRRKSQHDYEKWRELFVERLVDDDSHWHYSMHVLLRRKLDVIMLVVFLVFFGLLLAGFTFSGHRILVFLLGGVMLIALAFVMLELAALWTMTSQLKDAARLRRNKWRSSQGIM
jgi:hypothetical protein